MRAREKRELERVCVCADKKREKREGERASVWVCARESYSECERRETVKEREREVLRNCFFLRSSARATE